MSDANQTAVSYRAEASFRESSAEQQLTVLRLNKCDLKHTKMTVSSEEIRPDGNIPDLVQVGIQDGGSIEFEFNCSDFDPFMKAVLQGTLVSGNATASLAAAGGNALTDGGATITGATKTALKGARWVKVAGFTATGNNGIKKLLSETGGVYTFAAASFPTVETASVTLTWLYMRNGRLAAPQGFFFEEKMPLTATTSAFLRHIGNVPAQFEIDAKARAKIMGKLTFMGYGGTTDSKSLGGVRATGVLTSDTTNVANLATVTIGTKVYTFETSLTNVDGHVLIGADASASLDNLVAAINLAAGAGTTYATLTIANTSAVTAVKTSATVVTITSVQSGTSANAFATTETSTHLSWGAALMTGGTDSTAASTSPVVNSTSNIGQMQMDGAAFTNPASSLTLTINNNVRERPVIGDPGTLQPGSGNCMVTVKLEAYFTTIAQLQAYVNHTSFSLDIPIIDANGKQRSFYIPTVLPSDGWPTIPGINTDIMLPLDCQAKIDPTGTYTIQLDLVD